MNTVPARLARDSDGFVAVIGAGRPMRSACRCRRIRRGRTRWSIAMWCSGIRPECIAEAGAAFAGDARDLTIDALVEMSEPTGAETSGAAPRRRRALARSRPTSACRPAEAARFPVDTRTLCLFDPQRLIA